MGLSEETYIGPFVEAKQRNIPGAGEVETFMVNSDGDRFYDDSQFDPKTGEKLQEKTIEHDFYCEGYSDALDMVENGEVEMDEENYKDVHEDDLFSPEINEDGPTDTFVSIPNLPGVGYHMGEDDVAGVKTFDDEHIMKEKEKFKKQYAKALKFMEEFFGEDNVKIKYGKVSYVI